MWNAELTEMIDHWDNQPHMYNHYEIIWESMLTYSHVIYPYTHMQAHCNDKLMLKHYDILSLAIVFVTAVNCHEN